MRLRFRAARPRAVSGAWSWGWRWPAAGGTAGAVLNAANEAAVAAFLRRRATLHRDRARAAGPSWNITISTPAPRSNELLRAGPLGSPGGNALGLHLMALVLDWRLVLVILEVAVGLGMVIFVHELGHFVVAKLCGVKCEKFYLGFDIDGLKLAKLPLGRNRVRHRHPAVGRLRQDARPGRQPRQGRRGTPPLAGAGRLAVVRGRARRRRAARTRAGLRRTRTRSTRAATWPRACRSGWPSSRPAW